jgi:predicted ATP-grasp superfamily ATP-dependent carboligase
MFVVIIATDAGLARVVLRVLAGVASGIAVVGSAPELGWSARCDRYVGLDLSEHNAAQLAEVVNDIAAGHDRVVALPADVPSTRALLAARESLRCKAFPIPPRELLDRFDNKWEFYNLCRQLGAPTPETQLIADPAEFLVTGTQVIKPLGLRDSIGVVTVGSQVDYQARVLDDPDYPRTLQLIAQQYIPGRDIDISVLALDGKIMCSAVQVRIGKVVRFLEQTVLYDALERLVEATGYSGVVHVDAREHAEDGSIWLIEANPRCWGTLQAALWCGLNFLTAGIAAALDMPIDQPNALTDGHFPGTGRALRALAGGRCTPEQRRYLQDQLTDPYEYRRLVRRTRSKSPIPSGLSSADDA